MNNLKSALRELLCIQCDILDPESEVLMTHHKLHSYTVDLFEGKTVASFSGYHTLGALTKNGKAVNSITCTLKNTPPKGYETEGWIYSVILDPDSQSSGNHFNGATAVFKELPNV